MADNFIETVKNFWSWVNTSNFYNFTTTIVSSILFVWFYFKIKTNKIRILFMLKVYLLTWTFYVVFNLIFHLFEYFNLLQFVGEFYFFEV